MNTTNFGTKGNTPGYEDVDTNHLEDDPSIESFAVACTDLHGVIGPFFNLNEAREFARKSNRKAFDGGIPCNYRVVALMLNREAIILDMAREGFTQTQEEADAFVRDADTIAAFGDSLTQTGLLGLVAR